MKDEPIPSDQYERCKRELARLSRLVEEVDAGLSIAKNVHKHEAQRALSFCSKDLQTAGYWLGEALKEMKAI